MFVIRVGLLRRVPGCLPTVLKLVLRQCFFNSARCIFKTTGVFLKLFGDVEPSVRLYAETGVLLSDMVALEDSLLLKGHRGFKLCILCANTYNHTMGGDAMHCAWCVPSTCLDTSRIRFHTDASIVECARRLETYKATLSKPQFEEKEFIVVLEYIPDSLLCCPQIDLQLASSIMYDWMHVYACWTMNLIYVCAN